MIGLKISSVRGGWLCNTAHTLWVSAIKDFFLGSRFDSFTCFSLSKPGWPPPRYCLCRHVDLFTHKSLSPQTPFTSLHLHFLMCPLVLLYQIKRNILPFEASLPRPALHCAARNAYLTKYSSTGDSEGVVPEFLDLFGQEPKHRKASLHFASVLWADCAVNPSDRAQV